MSKPSTWPTARQHRDRHRHQNRCTDRYFGRGGNPCRHRRPRQAHRCRQQHRSRNRIGASNGADDAAHREAGVRTMRGETALTRRPITHPRRLSAGKPQWLPGGAKGRARRDSNPNLLIRRHGPMVRPGAMRVPLSCRWRCREARLSSSLSSSPGGDETWFRNEMGDREAHFKAAESFRH